MSREPKTPLPTATRPVAPHRYSLTSAALQRRPLPCTYKHMRRSDPFFQVGLWLRHLSPAIYLLKISTRV